MEVRRDNFLQVFPAIEEAVNEADFIAIDGEFTGLGTSLPSSVLYDTPAQRYERLRKGLSELVIIQYGICTFKFKKEKQSYEAKPFNVYIFPRPYNRREQFFRCQSSSLEFLASQGFDFNKLINSGKDIIGLSYVSPTEEEKLRKKNQKYNVTNNVQNTPKSKEIDEDDLRMKSPVFIPSTMKEFVEDICTKVKSFVESQDTSLDLDRASAFKRKLTYVVIEERYPSKFHVETITNDKGDKSIRIIKADEAERQRLRAAVGADKMAELETAIGFFKIIKLIKESKKLIVGHNMLLDLLLTINQFFTKLPESYEDFKELMTSLFPKVVDTKLMATSSPLNENIDTSALGPLHQFLEQNKLFQHPEIVFSDGFDGYDGITDKFHEAGYDAFCTGSCFAKMAARLCDFYGNKSDETSNSIQEYAEVDVNAEILRPFINRVYVMRINDLSYLTMDGPDDIPDRRNSFFLKFPSEWKYAEINSLFKDYGKMYISFLSDTTAYVSLGKEVNPDDVIQKFIVEKGSGPCQVSTYRQSVGLDPPDMYTTKYVDAKESNSGKTKKSKRAAEENEKTEGKRKKRAPSDALEEGEVRSNSEASADEEQEASKSKRPKNTKGEKKNEGCASPDYAPSSPFHVPNEW